MRGSTIVCGQEWTDKSDKTESNCSFSPNMIKGFADPKMHAIGQSVHHGRLIELEKPEQAADYIWSDSSRKSETPKTRQRFLVDGIIAGDLSIQFSDINILTVSSWNWEIDYLSIFHLVPVVTDFTFSNSFSILLFNCSFKCIDRSISSKERENQYQANNKTRWKWFQKSQISVLFALRAEQQLRRNSCCLICQRWEALPSSFPLTFRGDKQSRTPAAWRRLAKLRFYKYSGCQSKEAG